MLISFFQLNKLNTSSLTKFQIWITTSIVVFYNIAFFVVTFFFICIFESLELKDSITKKNAFLFLSSVFMYLQFCLSFMMLLSCAYFQMLALNRFLSVQNASFEIKSVDTIKKISIIYDKLCDVCENLSLFFLIHNLSFIVGYKIFTTFFFYSVFVYCKNPASEGLIYVFAGLLWFSFCTPYFLWIAALSSWIESEAHKTSTFIQLLKTRTGNLNIGENSNNFSLMFAHRKPKITAGGINFNWKGCFAILGSIFSLTIITIQFYDVSNN